MTNLLTPRLPTWPPAPSRPRPDPILHVRFAGRSFDVALSTLGLEATSRNDLIKRVIADQLDAPFTDLERYVIDRHANGNLTLRTEDP